MVDDPQQATVMPAAYDVFNGDADGICALHQLRLAFPRKAALVTGVKRDIGLLERVPCRPGIDVTVLDISLDANAFALRRLLNAGGKVAYFDHHSAQMAFEHPCLHLTWDDSPEVCTSILVDRHVGGRFRKWAVVAAFGDNLKAVGRALARELGLVESRTQLLEELGCMINYNAYGDCVEDLHVGPAELFRALHPFADPFDFIATTPEYRLLRDGYLDDTARMLSLKPAWESPAGAIYILPAAQWARRISGVFANQLVSPTDTRSYAVLTESRDGSYVVSVRSGQPARRSANGLCERFATGGGRKSAAGVNVLPADAVDVFRRAFWAYFECEDGETSDA